MRCAPNSQGRGPKNPISVLPAAWRTVRPLPRGLRAQFWFWSNFSLCPVGYCSPCFALGRLCHSAALSLTLGCPGPARGVKAVRWLSTPCGLLRSTTDDPLNGPLSARLLCLAHELASCFTGGQLCEGIIWLYPWRARCHWWRALALASAAVSHAATTR